MTISRWTPDLIGGSATVRSVRLWSQDLTKDDNDRSVTWGGIWRHGRATLWLDDADSNGRSLHGEWSFVGDTATGVSVQFDSSDGDWHFHAAAYKVFALFLQVKGILPRIKGIPNYEPRALSVSAHDGSIFWNVWKDPHSWSRADGWRNSSWSWKDWLLGKTSLTRTEIRKETVWVPMPEGNYPCEITLEQCEWRRPRGIFGWGERSAIFADVQPLDTPERTPGHIPHPGKYGDDDGLFSLSCEASTIAKAIGKTVESVMRSRERHGGLNWTPPIPQTPVP